MKAIKAKVPHIFGLFEIDDAGTVLYARRRINDELSEADPQIAGRDFFNEVAGFHNTGELRHHFRRFIVSGRPVDSFVFNCLYDTETVQTRIFMTRAHESDSEIKAGIVILEIRDAAEDDGVFEEDRYRDGENQSRTGLL